MWAPVVGVRRVNSISGCPPSRPQAFLSTFLTLRGALRRILMSLSLRSCFVHACSGNPRLQSPSFPHQSSRSRTADMSDLNSDTPRSGNVGSASLLLQFVITRNSRIQTPPDSNRRRPSSFKDRECICREQESYPTEIDERG